MALRASPNDIVSLERVCVVASLRLLNHCIDSRFLSAARSCVISLPLICIVDQLGCVSQFFVLQEAVLKILLNNTAQAFVRSMVLTFRITRYHHARYVKYATDVTSSLRFWLSWSNPEAFITSVLAPTAEATFSREGFSDTLSLSSFGIGFKPTSKHQVKCVGGLSDACAYFVSLAQLIQSTIFGYSMLFFRNESRIGHMIALLYTIKQCQLDCI